MKTVVVGKNEFGEIRQCIECKTPFTYHHLSCKEENEKLFALQLKQVVPTPTDTQDGRFCNKWCEKEWTDRKGGK